MKVNHTPGPWRIAKANDGLHICGAKPGRLAEVFHGNAVTVATHAEQEANAMLMAAAPEMLEALKWAANYLKSTDETHEYSPYAKIKALLDRIQGANHANI